ncbi:unnamed protein product [Nippostrongylus brasiliensis]|uniref:SHSP domain-containing protein n=1 Tax=Nippostrongylus brasiliensis TaxID=27835 RepID=A0A0N4XCF9_NIPBR|nr:hypothetical protein Q1695_002908 [Nippostrongylus brasiliensis]VDL62402.1 unnamed protein product [Nippostrongylus brasiliensis]
MALWPSHRTGNLMNEFMRDFERPLMRDLDWMERQMMPYWRDDERNILQVANQAHEVVNDEKKFAVALDVSKFKPEELKVHIEGRDLTIEGKQEEKTDHGYIERSFVRKWALPDECDLDAVHTQLNETGKLEIEAPKTGQHTNRRVLPIMSATKTK